MFWNHPLHTSRHTHTRAQEFEQPPLASTILTIPARPCVADVVAAKPNIPIEIPWMPAKVTTHYLEASIC